MSGWTWRAPNEITGAGDATVDALAGGRRPAGRLGEHPEDRGLVQAELAVAGADPEDDLLGPDRVAVVERLDLRSRRGRSSARTWPRRFFASSIPHSIASWRAKTSIVTSGSRPSRSRMLAARAKYTSAESPDRISRDGRVRTRPISRDASRSVSSFALRVRGRVGLAAGRAWVAECSVRVRAVRTPPGPLRARAAEPMPRVRPSSRRPAARRARRRRRAVPPRRRARPPPAASQPSAGRAAPRRPPRRRSR